MDDIHTGLDQAVLDAYGWPHDLTDEQCLELAQHIRVILVDFTDRVGEALRERKELQDSLTKLIQADKPQEPSEGTDSQKEEQNK